MKKLYTLLTTCLLLLFVTPMQSIDAGVGHSRSGSSSHSSSSSNGGRSRSSSSNSGSSSYRSSYSSGDGSYSSSYSEQELYGIVVFLIGVYVVVLVLKNKSNQSSSEKSYSSATVYNPQNHRRVEHNTLATSRVKYGDPNFDADAFASWVKEVYIQLQAAWTKKDWNLARSLESTSLYS